MKVIFIFALLFWLGNCDWNQCQQILRENDTTSFASIFADNCTGYMYAFYSKTEEIDLNIESYLCFREFTPMNQIAREQCIQQTRLVENISVSGDCNGKLYVTYSARRRMRTQECIDSVSTDGCYDIFFTESINAGRNWSIPVALPRVNNTASHRTSPTILSITEKKTILIAFTRWIPEAKNHSVMIVTRDASGVFAPEVYLGNWSYYISRIAFKYSMVKQDPVYYLLFQKEESILSRFVSEDGGKKWIETHLRDDSPFYRYAMTESWEKDQLYIVSIGNDSKFQLHWVELNASNPLSWHTRKWEFLQKSPAFRPLLINLPGQNHKIMFTAILTSNNPSIYIFDTEYETMKELHIPAPLSSWEAASTNIVGGNYVRVIYNLTSKVCAYSVRYVMNSLILNE